MDYTRKDDHIIVRLHPGDDVHKSLSKIVRTENIRGGAILCGVGMLRRFALGYFDGKDYSKGTYDTPHELISLQGTIAYAAKGGLREGELVIHLHATLGDQEHKVVGGHLESGTVGVLSEIIMYCPGGLSLSRRHNPRTGLLELDI